MFRHMPRIVTLACGRRLRLSRRTHRLHSVDSGTAAGGADATPPPARDRRRTRALPGPAPPARSHVGVQLRDDIPAADRRPGSRPPPAAPHAPRPSPSLARARSRASTQCCLSRLRRPSNQMPDAYCRACHTAFPRPLPAPYGAICPNCVARGDIVTLTDVPRGRITGRDRARGRSRGTPAEQPPHHQTTRP